MPSSPSNRLAGIFVFALLLGNLACGGGPREEDLGFLPGYWEIERVVFPDGQKREYSANTTVDFYHLEGREGYLKKLQPEADGRFLASDDALPLRIESREGGFVLRFQGDEGTWDEELVELGPDRLVTRNEDGLRYEYKRYEPLQIPGDGTQR